MTVKVMNGKKVEAEGDTAAEALWDLKRQRPHDKDFMYPVVDDAGRVSGVHVRTGKDRMSVLELNVVEDTK